ncbi:hypothetical protein GJAV_G00225600 [Gymnothorax javanicus]|nr:hypothetical protein GJAV_G00225600 [Gymnothorax javanicus]
MKKLVSPRCPIILQYRRAIPGHCWLIFAGALALLSHGICIDLRRNISGISLCFLAKSREMDTIYF